MFATDEIQALHIDLNELRERYNDIFDLSPSGLFLLKQDGSILNVNQAAANLLGVEKDGLINKNFSRYIAPDYQHEFSQHRKHMMKKSTVHKFELKLLQKYKSLLYVQFSGKVRLNSRAEITEILLMVESSSNRKLSDENDIEDMNWFGQGNVMVNALNQPLAIIGNYIYGCIYRLEKENPQIYPILQAMKQAEQELHRTAEIIMRMKNFSCKEMFKYEAMCINSIISEIIELINHEILDFPVVIRFRPQKSLPKLMLDKLYIQQAILNIARNAIEAMQDINLLDPTLIIEVSQPNQNMIDINFIDNGPAFKMEAVHKLFDPNVTTKSYGIGLGLILSRIIIESHGGKLGVELNPTRGACFTISLPILPPTKKIPSIYSY